MKPRQRWREFQDEVARAFMSRGFRATVETTIQGARGRHKVDVFATLLAGNLSPKIVVDCKYWNRPVSKSAALALHGVVQDVGANYGFLLTTRGVQEGCRQYLSGHTGIRVLDLFSLGHDLDQLMAQGFPGFLPGRE